MKLQNYTSCIEVDGKPLEEFCEETSPDGQMATCWIASEEGKPFVIYGEDSQPTSDSCVVIDVDGQPVGYRVALTSATLNTRTFRRDYGRVALDSGRKLMFSKLQVSEDESAELEGNYAKIGTIAVSFHDATILPLTGVLNFTDGMVTETHPISERSKKAGAHCVGLGAKVEVPAVTACATARAAMSSATFVFKYRPIELLIANGLAPAALLPNLPEPVGAGDNPAHLESGNEATAVKSESDENDDLDAARLRALEVEMEAIKARRALKNSDRPNKRVKREPISHNGVFAQGEVIDLTCG